MIPTESNSEVETPRESGDENALGLRHYIEIVRKRIWIVAAIVAIGVTATIVWTLRQPKIYQATASVVVDPQPPQVFGPAVQEVIQLGASSSSPSIEYYNTQLLILKKYPLALMTVKKPAAKPTGEEPNTDPLYLRIVPQHPSDGLTEEERIAVAASQMMRMLDVRQRTESRVIDVQVRNSDPQLATDLANEHIRSYMDWTRGLRVEGSDDTTKFLAAELDLAEKSLHESEKELYQFKKDNDILSVSLADKQNIVANDISRYTSALSDARIRRIELASIRQRALDAQDNDILESPVFALVDNQATADSLKENYVTQNQLFLELAANLGPKNPDYIKQKAKIDQLYQAIQQEARRAMLEIESQYQAAVTNEQKLIAEVDRLKEEAFALGPLAIEHNRLERREKSDEEAYQLVLNRLRTSQLTGKNKQTNISEHEMSRDTDLVYPRLDLNIALAAALSLMVGLGLAFLLDFLDRSLKSAEDVERTVGAPLLGVIPIVDDVNGEGDEAIRDRDLYVFNHPTSRAAECCRSIRTNILFSSADNPMKSITVSSGRPREGKTTSTIYLGTIMAQSGQRVLLVDTDLRKPRLHKPLGVSRTRGITNLILGDASLDDCIKTTDIPNLFVLPCGPQPPNPAELLLSNRFKEVMEQLEERFDRVIFDSPPLLAVTDGAVLARLTDGVVIVAQAGKTTLDDAATSARTIRDVKARIIGVILNDLDISQRKYGYYTYYYNYSEGAAEGES